MELNTVNAIFFVLNSHYFAVICPCYDFETIRNCFLKAKSEEENSPLLSKPHNDMMKYENMLSYMIKIAK